MTPDEKVAHDVASFGWHVVKVLADDAGPGFAYTVGLTRTFQHPELIIFGLPPQVMHEVLNLAGKSIRSGHRFAVDSTASDLIEGYDCHLVQFPQSAHSDYLGRALSFYRNEPIQALQCVWPDRQGRFPWNSDADPSFREIQPLF